MGAELRGEAVELELVVNRGGEPIRGVVRLGGRERHFTGWLVLMTALDELLQGGGTGMQGPAPAG